MAAGTPGHRPGRRLRLSFKKSKKKKIQNLSYARAGQGRAGQPQGRRGRAGQIAGEELMEGGMGGEKGAGEEWPII